MNDITKYLLCMIILATVAKLLTFIKPYKIALIKRAVKMAENKYSEATKSGEQKKAFVLKILKWCLIQTDDTTSNIIDAIVSIANDKHSGLATTVTNITSVEIDAKMNTTSTY